MFFSKKPKTLTGLELLGEKLDKVEELKENVRGLPVLLLWLIANLTGMVIAPGVSDRLWPGIENKPDAIFYIAFAVVSTLSARCFSMSASISNNETYKEGMAFAGERFLHSSFQFLTGAIFHYVASMMDTIEISPHPAAIPVLQFFTSAIDGIEWLPIYEWVHLISIDDLILGTVLTFGWIAVLMYWSAVQIAYTGVKITHNVM